MDVYPVSAFTDNYIWMLTDKSNQKALCVDPGEAQPVIHYLNEHKLALAGILLTHHHPDHISGLTELLRYYAHTPVYGPDDDRIPASVNHDTEFRLQNWHFQVLSIPGHTSSHIAFYEPEQEMLFCGDTLFSAGCGRVFDGTIRQLHDSLTTLKTLPESTRVYCGHEYTRQNLRFAAEVEPHNKDAHEYYQELMQNPKSVSLPSSIGLEKRVNPFLRLDEPSVRSYAQKRGCPSLETVAVFKQLREDKNNFS